MNENYENSKDGEKVKHEMASLKSMFLGLNKRDKLMYIIAIIFATLNGCTSPTFAIFFSDMIDSFNPSTPKSQLIGKFFSHRRIKIILT